MTLDLTSSSTACSASIEAGSVRLVAAHRAGGHTAVLHPNWLRDHTQEPSQIEATNRQRLFTPLDLPLDLAAVGCSVEPDALVVEFSDSHRARYRFDWLARTLGWVDDPEQPPAAAAWVGPVDLFPYVDWTGIGWTMADQDPTAVLGMLSAFYRHGFVVLRQTPTEAGTVERIANRLGYLVPTNFGPIFDVRTEPKPADLAYTAIGLAAHTDLPYRQPVPGIQLLHCLANNSPGGDSTLVDGLAAASAVADHDPELFRALTETEVEYRYDMVSDTVVGRGRTIELDRNGRFVGVRLNPKLDSPVIRQGADVNASQAELGAFYRARRWFVDWVNDPAHVVRFRLEPGDVMVMDNHRVLHGRTEFDPTRGRRHLQGCYIEHDGPDTLYRLTVRQWPEGRREGG